MNKSCQLIRSHRKPTKPFNVKRARSPGLNYVSALLVVAAGSAFAGPPAVNALPTGGHVVAGVAAISQSGTTLNVNQSTARAALDWATFNVGSAASVNFNQPSASSVTLNRVLDSNPSQIFGRINANGQVFLTNPNGVYFAPGASVDVGGLVATTHAISNDDFMAGRDLFHRNGASGSIINEGTLSAELQGYVALLAPEVRNNGVIVAKMGTVMLAAGESYELNFAGSKTLASIIVTPATMAALVENGGAVHAPGGIIILSAQAASRLQGGVINNAGVLEASGLVEHGGVIRLQASDRISHTGSISANAAEDSGGHGGSVILLADLANPDSQTVVDGSISARGGNLGGNGGFIETSASRVKMGSAMAIDTSAPLGNTGTWLIDPDGYNIATTSGDATGAQISTQLTSNNITIQSIQGTGTGGNINVEDAISWSANKLTLHATNNINVNAKLTGTGSASLALEYGQGAPAAGNSSAINENVAISLPTAFSLSKKLGSDGVVVTHPIPLPPSVYPPTDPISSTNNLTDVSLPVLDEKNGVAEKRYKLRTESQALGIAEQPQQNQPVPGKEATLEEALATLTALAQGGAVTEANLAELKATLKKLIIEADVSTKSGREQATLTLKRHQLVRDMEKKLREIQQTPVETNRGIARNI